MNWEHFISSKVSKMPPSGIRKFFDIVNEMEDAVSLGVGEPDFVTPWNIRQACVDSLEEGMTHYTSNWGMIELRDAVHQYLDERFDISYNPEGEILITVGASEGIDLALRTLIEHGDEVLIPDPSYVSYAPCVSLAGGVPTAVTCTAEDNFKLTPDHLKQKIGPKTKVLILPYPNNPTGAIMTRKELEAIAKVIEDTDIAVISDEIYAELTYNGDHVSFANMPNMRDRTILLNGFSKAFAMTGWRLGYAAGNPHFIGGMVKIHQYTMLCAPIMSQVAGLEALKSGFKDNFETVRNMVRQYNHRRRVILKGVRDMGLECFEPLGAFYIFPSIQKTGMTSEEFCERLLMEEKVAVVPGNAFGKSGEGFIRCSYAYSIDNINIALERMGNFVARYIK
ncbi:MAG: aminotransferase class I/II-fold pyridoxal phosphate-dependent enzyme [Clostridiales bacterium]|nr:aminotransferase class I/II-fold pyridoxal phosphate-dependent enzyme [Clostridiales bacterium]